VDEEVNRDKNGEADGMNLEVDSKDEVMHLNERSVIFKEEMVGGRKIVTTDENRVLRVDRRKMLSVDLHAKWNCLPNDFRVITDTTIFKKEPKAYFYKQTFFVP